MKLGLLRIGQVPRDAVQKVKSGLMQAFPNTIPLILDEVLPLPKQALDVKREQYRSNVLLNVIQSYAMSSSNFDRILGIVGVDIFVSGLNFVFGEAMHPGRAALISLWRLSPEFYGEPPNTALFSDRAVKEAVHEVGHTLGLSHCANPDCVMFFSNSIADTDRKQSLFCSRCAFRVQAALKA